LPKVRIVFRRDVLILGFLAEFDVFETDRRSRKIQ